MTPFSLSSQAAADVQGKRPGQTQYEHRYCQLVAAHGSFTLDTRQSSAVCSLIVLYVYYRRDSARYAIWVQRVKTARFSSAVSGDKKCFFTANSKNSMQQKKEALLKMRKNKNIYVLAFFVAFFLDGAGHDSTLALVMKWGLNSSISHLVRRVRSGNWCTTYITGSTLVPLSYVTFSPN